MRRNKALRGTRRPLEIPAPVTTTTSSGGGGYSPPIPESDVTNLVTDLAAKEATANKGASSGYASLNSSTKVVEDPANATATPTASKIVIADASGLVDGWVSDAAAGTKGKIKLAGNLGGTAALPTVVSVQAGAVTEAGLTTADNTTADVSSTKHGFAPKSPADATKFMNGASTPAYAQVKDSDLSTSDITTNDVSTSKHGFAPKAPNDATKFLDGTGAYSVPNGTTYDELDTLLGKKFFVDNSIIGSMTLFKRWGNTPDAFDGTSGSWTRDPGTAYSAGAGIAYYNIGSLKTEVLLISGGPEYNNNFPCLTMWPTTTAPTSESSNCIFAMNYNSAYIVQKQVSSAFTTLITASPYSVGQAAIAFWCNFTSKVKKIYARKNGNWYYCGTETSDSTFASIQYVGFRMHSGAGRFHAPFACYTN
jgi:hypothetical protein